MRRPSDGSGGPGGSYLRTATRRRETMAIATHRIATREGWTAAREELLAREKEHTRLGAELARQPRELPSARVEKEYRSDTDDGARTLPGLFHGRSQLA